MVCYLMSTSAWLKIQEDIKRGEDHLLYVQPNIAYSNDKYINNELFLTTIKFLVE